MATLQPAYLIVKADLFCNPVDLKDLLGTVRMVFTLNLAARFLTAYQERSAFCSSTKKYCHLLKWWNLHVKEVLVNQALHAGYFIWFQG